MTSNIRFSPRLKSRILGLCYLLTICTGVFDHIVVGSRVIVAGNPAATTQSLLASESLYRLAFALDLIPVYAVVTVLLYELFKPVSRSLSLLAAFASFIGGAVGSSAAIFQLAPIVVLNGATQWPGFNPLQLQGLVQIFLRLHELGFSISLMFFGLYCSLLGWMIVRSIFISRGVGVLMGAAGMSYMLYSFAYCASPSFAAGISPYALVLGSIGEIALTVWLLAVGIDSVKWNQQLRMA
ncbi:MAG: DUF4386 domain-containing protein [Steroidobacteraceae bacterium]